MSERSGTKIRKDYGRAQRIERSYGESDSHSPMNGRSLRALNCATHDEAIALASAYNSAPELLPRNLQGYGKMIARGLQVVPESESALMDAYGRY